MGSLRHAAGEGLGEILLVAGDVTSATELEAAFDSAQARFGSPALVVTCAGTAEVTGPAWSADADLCWQAVAVDLQGTMLTARSAIPRMLAAGAGR